MATTVARTSFKLEGAERVRRELKSIANRYPGKMEAALTLEAERIMTVSKQDYVPVDDNPLRSSGHVQPTERSGRLGLGDDVEISLSFGGSSAPYALAVHEHPSDHSPPTWEGKVITFSPPGRGPKYLEIPFRLARVGMAARVAKTLGVDRGVSV